MGGECQGTGVSLEKYTSTVLREVFARANVPVVVDPKGVVRTLDGHHKLLAWCITREVGHTSWVLQNRSAQMSKF